MITAVLGSLLPGLFKIGDKLIEDKDKKMEYAFKIQEMAFKQMEILTSMQTVPWLDAMIKLAYASEVIIKGLFRPVGAAIMTGVAVYVDIMGVEMSETLHTILSAAFPAWMTDRGIDKFRNRNKPKDEDMF